MFKVVITSRTDREFGKLPRNLKEKFYREFKRLEINPFSSDVKKISGTKYGYRLRVGRWRILFALFSREKRIEIVDIFLKQSKEDYAKRIKLLP